MEESKKFPPWSPWLALVFVFVTYIVSQLVGQLLVSIYPLTKGWSAARTEDWLSSSTYAQFAYIAVVEAVCIGLLYWFMKPHKVTFKMLGLVRLRPRDVVFALAAVPVYFLGYLMLVSIITSLFPSINIDQDQQIGFDSVKSNFDLILTFVSLAILPPLAEEIIMRGFVFTSLLKRYKFVVASIVTSIIFALAHLQIGSGAPLLWVAAIDTFILSTVLCYMRYKTGSLWAGIILHVLKNSVAFVSIFILNRS